jgi:hypothetical protein
MHSARPRVHIERCPAAIPEAEVMARTEAALAARKAELREGAACVAYYQERREQYVAEHRRQLLAFRAERLLWAASDIHTHLRWEQERCKDYREAPLFTIRAVPAAQEIERLAAYAGA